MRARRSAAEPAVGEMFSAMTCSLLARAEARRTGWHLRRFISVNVNRVRLL